MRMLFFFSMLACRDGQNKENFNETGLILDDADNDGYDSSIDCDDDNPAIHPGSTEICDGIDNDCDGNIDDGVWVSFFEDSDGDGFGNPIESTMACEVPEGFVTNGSDCDDNEPDAYPGNVESCDGIDNDCNDSIDDGLGDSYIDSDRDGFGDDSNTSSLVHSGMACLKSVETATTTTQALIPSPLKPVTNSTTTVMEMWMRASPKLFFPDQDEDGYGENVGSVEAAHSPRAMFPTVRLQRCQHQHQPRHARSVRLRRQQL